MATQRIEAFSLTHAQIMDGEETFLEAALNTLTDDALDVYGVNSASISPNTDSFTNEGDDVGLSKWNWLVDAELEVQAGYLSFPLYAEITGRATETVGTAPDQSFEADLWHEDDMNLGSKPMILKMPSKDEDGLVRTFTVGLYKVAFAPITFEGPEYKSGLKVNYNGTALFSKKDEAGVAFPDGKNRVGRLLSHG